MRTSLSILLVVAILFGGGYWYHIVLAVCDVPITYRIGTVDERFKLTEDEIRTALSDAESLWEDGTDRNLMSYDPAGELVVNFVYDERQARTDEETALRAELEREEGMSDGIKSEYTKLIERYEALKDSYARDVKAYEARLRAYNDEVADWNDRGGAPKDVYERLTKTQAMLRDEESRLNTRTTELNTIAEKINAVSTRGNVLVENYNELVSVYNDRFAEVDEFTQGDYASEGAISIYEFSTHDELVIVLAHEFGHALGLDHVGGESSIMYAKMEAQSRTSGLTPEDLGAFQATCGTTESQMAATLERLRTILLGMLARLGT